MNKMLIIYVLTMSLVGWAMVDFLMTSSEMVETYREICYEKYGKDHLKCAFVGE